MANSATFRIRSVKCRDEMGGSFRENFGNDEIKCAVFSADLRGSTRNSGRIDIHDDFDDRDIKTFDPPREVVTLDLAGAAGEVELAFSVLLIESQLTEGNSLQKAWDAFVEIYGKELGEQLGKRTLSIAQARAVAQPGYLRPTSVASRIRGAAVSTPGTITGTTGGAVGTMGNTTATSLSTASSTAASAGNASTAAGTATDTGTVIGNAPGTEPDTADKVGDAFIVALVTACVMFGVKYAGSAVSALIGWAQDKMFPPMAIKLKIDASTPPENVPANATGVAEFRGHDGIYEMEWDILVR